MLSLARADIRPFQLASLINHLAINCCSPGGPRVISSAATSSSKSDVNQGLFMKGTHKVDSLSAIRGAEKSTKSISSISTAFSSETLGLGKQFHPHHSNSSSKNRGNKSLSSLKSVPSMMRMKIITIRALQDNYMYLLIDDLSRQAAAVDPVNASAIAEAIHDQGAELKAILTTHHHHDHAHGNSELLGMFPEISVYGGDNRIQAITKTVAHGDTIKLGSLNIECLATPCHTKGHICYYVTTEPDHAEGGLVERAVFTGDTLFIGGCGRFFEGSSEQMDHSLNQILANLPPDTKVYCGHEYTVKNLKFGLLVEPQNADIKTKLTWAQNKVGKREPTVPSTIGEERRINPFMRLKKPSVRRFTGETDELEVMTVLRQRKNEF